MGFWGGAAEWIAEAGATALGVAEKVPLAGEALNLGQGLGNLGMEVYHAATGNDQAMEHDAVGATLGFAGAIPIAHEIIAGGTLGWNGAHLVDSAINGEEHTRHGDLQETITQGIFGHR